MTLGRRVLVRSRWKAFCTSAGCASKSAAACITGTGKIVMGSPNTANMAINLMHEIGHDLIPDTGAWDEASMYEEPILHEWGAQLWGKMPSSLYPAQGGMGIFWEEYRRNPARFRQHRVHVACEHVKRNGGKC